MSSQIPEPPPSAAHVKADNASIGELLGDVTRDLSTLMRQEVELAKAELKQSTSRAGKGAGMLAGAGVGGHFVLVFLSLALMFALGAVMALGWAALIVAVLWAIIAAVLASIGRKELKQIKGLPQTGETLAEIPPTLKPGEVNR
ncbi:phage holin family protein [Pseudarthrobacter sp. CC12]|uniref:phage holin family protein n=1 Tax=unclassified Pseudarthrobacter TaxID=2647000 RepID=UPI001131BEDD|nr:MULTISPECIES: phage holin family protein [unclassified Pseudarthrobacter]QDG61353.1 phage holin family protein [Pseudarthrobacter sp. NIBRBAC000502771]QDG61742.1 phage holin family protein [Pseudarthrobacter sp. NIBRBAC000502771]QDG90202.1 phage holin family protein [Pseudarthrobacter sp. NIBRBAC000502770]QDG90569.1 phage holin family protein [Pseudarthrobacter sp. NIBRBAC000502770]